MAKRLGRSTFRMDDPPSALGFAAAGGKKEGEGPLGGEFDLLNTDTSFGEETWEKAESRLQLDAVRKALEKAALSPKGDRPDLCGGSFEPVRGLHLRAAGTGNPFFRGVRRLLHHGGEPLPGVAFRGQPAGGGKRMAVTFFPFLLRRAAVPLSAGIRQASRAPYRPVDGDCRRGGDRRAGERPLYPGGHSGDHHRPWDHRYEQHGSRHGSGSGIHLCDIF